MKPTCCDRKLFDSPHGRFVNAKPFSGGHILEPKKPADHLKATDSVYLLSPATFFWNNQGVREDHGRFAYPFLPVLHPVLWKQLLPKANFRKRTIR